MKLLKKSVKKFIYRMDRNMTKYHEIAEQLSKQIINGQFEGKLPTEAELACQFDTSRVVISRVLKILSMKDLINVIPGSGIYIKEKNRRMPTMNTESAGLHDGFSNSMKNKGKVTSHVISFTIREAEGEELKKLKLKKGDLVYDIIRQRLVDGKAMKLEYTMMPVKVIPGITDEVLNQSIYSYIKNELKLELGKANRIIMADKVDAYDVEYLDCQVGDAILAVHQVAFLTDGRPFELSETRDRYDRAAYFLFEVES